MSALRQPRKRLGWIAFGLGMIALRVVMDWAPGFAEDMYGRGVFPLIRLIQDYSLGLLPFPAVYLLLFLLVWWLRRRWLRRQRDIASPLQRLGGAVISALAVVFAIIGLFLVLWGFNYARIPLRHQLELPLDPMDGPALVAELERTALELNRLVRRAPVTPGGELENRVRSALAGTLDAMDWPTVGRPRIRFFHPGSLIMAFGVSGIYNFFSGEATLPAGLPRTSRAFTAAHEAAHAWGITDEGEANLAAFLACSRSGDAELAYSAHLALWGYLARPLSRIDSSGLERVATLLSPRVRNDMAIARAHWRRYRGGLMRAAAKVNDAYLRSQGIAAGVVSYESFPALLRAWRRRETELRGGAGKAARPE